MTPDRLHANIDKTIIAMKAQTGLEPGQPTGLCHSFVVGALTGGDIIFSATRTGPEQVLFERQHGLFLYPVYVRPPSTPWKIMPELLEQDAVELDAVVVSDRPWGFTRSHMAAIVPHNRNAPYEIVDSLSPTGRSRLNTTDDVTDYLDSRFTGERTELYVSFSEEERKRRDGKIVIVGENIFIHVLQLHKTALHAPSTK